MNRNREKYERLIQRFENKPDNEKELIIKQSRLKKEIQNSINHRINEDNNIMLQKVDKQPSDISLPRISPYHTSPSRTPFFYKPEKGLLVDPDLLSSHLNRLRIDLF